MSGSLWTPFVKAAELFAASESFQEMVAAEDAAEALAKIVFPTFYTPGTDSIPLAVLWKHQGHTRTRRTWDGDQSGSLLITFYDLIPEDKRGDEPADYADWTQRLDDIFNEAMALANTAIPGDSGGDWYWPLTAFEEMDPPGWLDEAATGIAHCRTATYRLEWNG